MGTTDSYTDYPVNFQCSVQMNWRLVKFNEVLGVNALDLCLNLVDVRSTNLALRIEMSSHRRPSCALLSRTASFALPPS